MEERAVFDALSIYRKTGSAAYGIINGSATTGDRIWNNRFPDSDLQLGFFIHPGFTQWTYDSKSPTKDEVLDDITLLLAYKYRNIGRSIILGK
jgi:hypothetical protein